MDEVEDEDFMGSSTNRPPRRGLRRLLGGSGGRRRRSNNDALDEDFVDEDGSIEDGSAQVDEAASTEVPLVGPPPTVPPKAPTTFQPSHLHTKITELSNESTLALPSPRNPVPDPYQVAAAMPPPAREAAFHGPPRFDWIDIVRVASFGTDDDVKFHRR